MSILVKLWMTLFNRKIAKKINSVANGATALDSLSDCVATAVVILCAILSRFIKGVPLDGIAGLLVAIFIAYTGASSLKSIADLLLGAPPDHELVKEITDFALNFDKQKIIGIHDLIVNDYGPGRKIIILHAEVPAKGDVMQLHDAIDNLENALAEKFRCMAVIHMDPVDNESERVAQLKETVRHIVKELDPEYDVHDFRMNEGDTHANLIFDLVIPYDESIPKSRYAISLRRVSRLSNRIAFRNSKSSIRSAVDLPNITTAPSGEISPRGSLRFHFLFHSKNADYRHNM